MEKRIQRKTATDELTNADAKSQEDMPKRQ